MNFKIENQLWNQQAPTHLDIHIIAIDIQIYHLSISKVPIKTAAGEANYKAYSPLAARKPYRLKI